MGTSCLLPIFIPPSLPSSLPPSLPLSPTLSFSIQGRTDLHAAAERGDVKTVQRLIATAVNIDINSRTENVRMYYCTVALKLLCCIRTCCILASCIITFASFPGLYICNRWFPLIQDGLTALHLASMRGHIAIVRLLIQARAAINLRSKVRLLYRACFVDSQACNVILSLILQHHVYNPS